LILRQQWAIVYLGILKSKKRVINIDESWVGQMDFTRQIWAPKYTTHSIPIKQVKPRISMIMALDNFGEVYASFTQVNTDSKVMSMYIKELVNTLDDEDRNWRHTSIFMHDGAKYAQSKSTQATLKDLRVPFMLLAPHSYNVAPIELLFGAIKTGNLNPGSLPTGKR
jgi:hypothetical protein